MEQHNFNDILKQLDSFENILKGKLLENESLSVNSIKNELKELLTYIKNINEIEKYKTDDIKPVVLSLIYSINKALSENKINYVKYEVMLLLQNLGYKIYKLENDINLDTYSDDLKREHFMNEIAPKYGTSYLVKDYEEKGKFKYDLSILVLAYNNVEYTKSCVDSISKHLPTSVSYELILFNHGSTDDTLEYFKSVPNAKVIDIHKNGPGFELVFNVLEGEFVVFVSNDVLITENAIENMLKCIKSDDKISMAVPLTTYVSNDQNLDKEFESLDEMYSFASKFNVSNSLSWEQKSSLVTPTLIARTSRFSGKNGVHFSTKNIGFKFAFTDDLFSYLFRQSGGKLMLLRDTFCYHFGSITVNSEISQSMQIEKTLTGNEYYTKERAKFYRFYQYDPYFNGGRTSLELFYYLTYNKLQPVDILGIGSGLGGSLYKLKYKIQSYNGNENIFIHCVNDIRALDKVVEGGYDYYANVENSLDISIIEQYENKGIEFDYILIEDFMPKHMDTKKYFDTLLNILKPNGEIAVQLTNSYIGIKLLSIYPWIQIKNNWAIIRHQEHKSQKMLLPCKVLDWSNTHVNNILDVFDALLTQEFDINIEINKENISEIAQGCEIALVNDISFYEYVNKLESIKPYLRILENILIVDEDNIGSIIKNLELNSLATYFDFKYIPTTKEIEDIIKQKVDNKNIIKIVDYCENASQHIYNNFISYYLALKN